MNKFMLTLLLTVPGIVFSQTKKEQKDTLNVQLTEWEFGQFKMLKMSSTRQVEIQKEIQALQTEFNLLRDKEVNTWGAFYNAHHEVAQATVESVLGFDENNGALLLKIKKETKKAN